MVKCCVFFAVRTELNSVETSFGFKGLSDFHIDRMAHIFIVKW
jgi:hypothetical protein